jgi:hypothetical protein
MASSIRLQFINRSGMNAHLAGLLAAADQAWSLQERAAGVRAIQAIYDFMDETSPDPAPHPPNSLSAAPSTPDHKQEFFASFFQKRSPFFLSLEPSATSVRKTA